MRRYSLGLGLLVLLVSSSQAQDLFQPACTDVPVRNGDAAVSFFDGFDVPGNRLDTSRWTTEFGAPSFLGRTQLRDWVNGTGRFVVTDGAAQLALDTFNPTGFSLYGTHAKTLVSFQPTPATDWMLTVRMRLNSLRRGVVYGVYFYGCNPGPCGTRHDELDIEIVTNYLAFPQRIQLNRYAAEPLGAGHGPIVSLPAGCDPLAYHEWKIRWGLGRATYFVDNIELSSATDFIPQGPMQATMIAWGPAQDWPDAYDESLTPSTAGESQSFVALIDYVSVMPVMSTAVTLTTTTATSSPAVSTYGQPVTFTATVSPPSATGPVTFRDGSTTLGTGTLASGTATYATSSLASGTHSITASYGGDSVCSGSTSVATTETVNRARRRAAGRS